MKTHEHSQHRAQYFAFDIIWWIVICPTWFFLVSRFWLKLSFKCASGTIATLQIYVVDPMFVFLGVVSLDSWTIKLRCWLVKILNGKICPLFFQLWIMIWGIKVAPCYGAKSHNVFSFSFSEILSKNGFYSISNCCMFINML